MNGKLTLVNSRAAVSTRVPCGSDAATNPILDYARAGDTVVVVALDRLGRTLSGIIPLPAPGAAPAERGQAVMARWVARHGAPSLEHYRRVYEQADLEWPGDDEVRRRHVVGDGPVAGPAA